MRQQWFNHVRLLVAHLTRCQRAVSVIASHSGIDRRDITVVWTPRLPGEPGGPSSITGTARIRQTTFYIASLLLSGHTCMNRFAKIGEIADPCGVP